MNRKKRRGPAASMSAAENAEGDRVIGVRVSECVCVEEKKFWNSFIFKLF